MKVFMVMVAALAAVSTALNNGLALTPPMGYCSWNDVSSQVEDGRMRWTADQLVQSGLAAVGYASVHVDEGWIKGRDSKTNEIIVDSVKFPYGMKALGEYIHSKNLTYGLYTSRGDVQCGTSNYSAPGSLNYESIDTAFFASQGADYAKIDSCGGSQDHSVAFEEYGKWRDGFNATGRKITFSLCGWNPWYAPVGSSLGNLWRISGDGRNWYYLSLATDRNAYLGYYAGPGAWNDPDLLQGDGSGSYGPGRSVWYQSKPQSRTQMGMWSIMAAPLLLSMDIGMLASDEYYMATYANKEVIAVNQDPMGVQGFRVVGTEIGTDGSGIVGTNVWARPLHDGSWAIAFLNNDMTQPKTITCGPACLGLLQFNQTAIPGGLDGARAHYRGVAQQLGEAGPNGPWGTAQPANGNIGEGYPMMPVDGVRPVFLATCDASKNEQIWKYDNQFIINSATNECLQPSQCATANFNAVGLAKCSSTTKSSVTEQNILWEFDSSDPFQPMTKIQGGRINIDASCSSSLQKWNFTPSSSNGSISMANATDFCLDDYFYNTSRVEIFGCNGQTNQQWSMNSKNQIVVGSTGKCLQAAPLAQNLKVNVRDLFGQKDLQPINPSTDTIQIQNLPANGSIALLRLYL